MPMPFQHYRPYVTVDLPEVMVANEIPGTTIEYTVPDIYGRPWARIWERYHEAGMDRPEPQGLFGFD